MRIQTNFVRLLNLLIFHFLFYFTFFLSNILDCSPSPVGCTAMFIHGHGLSVPYASNIRTVANKIVSADTWTSPVGVSRKQAKAAGYVSVFFHPTFLSLEQALTSSPWLETQIKQISFSGAASTGNWPRHAKHFRLFGHAQANSFGGTREQRARQSKKKICIVCQGQSLHAVSCSVITLFSYAVYGLFSICKENGDRHGGHGGWLGYLLHSQLPSRFPQLCGK